ncbi:MAG: beta-class carbonic anhydrase [Myxococcota bacterium]
MTATDDMLRNNVAYAERFSGPPMPVTPAKHLAVVACMDSRIDVHGVLGLGNGDAHVIRNAGGIVTDDVIRSLALSQKLLGTREVLLIHHTDCGMMTFEETQMIDDMEQETGRRPPFALGAFKDLDADVRESILRIRESPFLHRSTSVRGFVYDVDTGRLREVA